jgi:branched-chain amino acid transport system ATP-binding protein
MTAVVDGATRPGTRLVVRGLHAGYGSMEAVAGIDLEVASGETVALIGRNGAGKTTSLLAVAGIRYGRGDGEVRLGDVDLSGKPPQDILAAGLSHCPEGHRIFSELTVEENLQLGAYSRRREGAAATAESMERVYALFPILRTYAKRDAGFLSGGEQQMVAIGQALMARPSILMLDEPTSGLALMVIRTITEALAVLREEGLGILLVEQSVPRALAVSDRTYVMERGRILMSGQSSVLAKDERVFDIVRGTTNVDTSAGPAGGGGDGT